MPLLFVFPFFFRWDFSSEICYCLLLIVSVNLFNWNAMPKVKCGQNTQLWVCEWISSGFTKVNQKGRGVLFHMGVFYRELQFIENSNTYICMLFFTFIKPLEFGNNYVILQHIGFPRNYSSIYSVHICSHNLGNTTQKSSLISRFSVYLTWLVSVE